MHPSTLGSWEHITTKADCCLVQEPLDTFYAIHKILLVWGINNISTITKHTKQQYMTTHHDHQHNIYHLSYQYHYF